jgi:hypothetical protein
MSMGFYTMRKMTGIPQRKTWERLHIRHRLTSHFT